MILLSRGVAIGLALLAVTTVARAEPAALPSAAACGASARTQRAYQSGWRGGQDLVSAAIHGNPCEALPSVERAVADALSRWVVGGPSEFTRCRTRGVLDGADGALADLRRACADGGR